MRRAHRVGAWIALAVAIAAGACGHAVKNEVFEAARAAPAATVFSARDIDEALRAAWERAGIEAAPRVDDARFLRRAWIDLAGVVPPPDVVARFLADRSPDKRKAAIAALVASPRWAEHWATIWERLLLGPDGKVPPAARDAFRGWVRASFAENERYDTFAYELVTATGRNLSEEGDAPVNGAVNWLLRFRDAPQDLAGTTARVFLGVRIQCAQCHDHKTERWTQDDFKRFTASFMAMKAAPVDREASKKEVELRDVDGPAYLRTRRRKVAESPYVSVRPAALDGTDLSASPNRRQALARWMVDPKNPWFARAFVNRVWDRLLGRGIVDPVDDLRPTNPPIMPEVLDGLAADFAAHGFDVRRLVATICETEAYQLAAAPARRGDGQLWSRRPLTPLGPDELLDSIVAATGIGPLLARLGGEDIDRLRVDLRRRMTFLFDVDEQSSDDAYQGTVPQALMLMNGRLVNTGATAIPGDALAEILAQGGGDEAVIEALYLRTLSRRPAPAEIAHWVRFVNAPRDVVRDEGPSEPLPKGGPKKVGAIGERKLARAERLFPRRETPKQQAFEDLLWALLNSSEFYFNH